MPSGKAAKITSPANPRVKYLVQLRDSKERDASGLTIVEGVNELSRAMEAGIAFKEVFLCDEILDQRPDAKAWAARCRALKTILYETTKEVFGKIAYGERREGVLAVCEIPQRQLTDFSFKKNPLLVVIEGVEKPGNIGAILRSCDGAGADGVILCDGRTDLYNPNVIRASLGTIFSLPVVVSSNEETLNFLTRRGIRIYASSPRGTEDYTTADLRQPLAIIVGSEQKGLSRFWMEKAQVLVRIPMKGRADSLNVSSSTAILLYEALRQRGW